MRDGKKGSDDIAQLTSCGPAVVKSLVGVRCPTATSESSSRKIRVTHDIEEGIRKQTRKLLNDQGFGTDVKMRHAVEGQPAGGARIEQNITICQCNRIDMSAGDGDSGWKRPRPGGTPCALCSERVTGGARTVQKGGFLVDDGDSRIDNAAALCWQLHHVQRALKGQQVALARRMER